MQSRPETWRTYDAADRARYRGNSRAVFSRLFIAIAAIFLFIASRHPSIAAEQASAAGIVSRIRREPVESRALAAVGYSRRLRVLEVEFRRGGTYRYLDVPWPVYRDLLAAESKAGFYNRNVRGKYRSVYVRPRRKQ